MMWVYNIKELSEQFYVLAVDAIGGSGKSEPNADYYKQFNQITWIDEILAGLGIQQTNICVEFLTAHTYLTTILWRDRQEYIKLFVWQEEFLQANSR